MGPLVLQFLGSLSLCLALLLSFQLPEAFPTGLGNEDPSCSHYHSLRFHHRGSLSTILKNPRNAVEIKVTLNILIL